MPTTIKYVKKFPKDQITIAEFKKVIEEGPADKLILDVRDSSSASIGMLKGAVSIPFDELDSRMSEISKDREILIHCNTGILASTALDKLAKAGYKTRYLDAVVQVGGGGTYEINPK